MEIYLLKRDHESKLNGDYRTERVILEIYYALTEAMRTGVAYQTRLDPLSADPRCCNAVKPRGGG